MNTNKYLPGITENAFIDVPAHSISLVRAALCALELHSSNVTVDRKLQLLSANWRLLIRDNLSVAVLDRYILFRAGFPSVNVQFYMLFYDQ